MIETPVLLIIYNRPELTEKVFDVIRSVRPKQLFIAADGPKQEKIADAARCAETRAVTEKINWDCDVKRLYRDKNLGCKDAITSGINWFFGQVEEGIILEDDCVPDETFFTFCKEMLSRYRNNERIMHINGTNFLLGKKVPGSYYFSNFAHPWGWAGWRRAWKKYDSDMKTFPEFKEKNMFDRVSKNKRLKNFWLSVLEKTYDGTFERNSVYDYQWFFTIWYNKGIVITPTVNLVSNIGFGPDATNTIYSYVSRSNMKRGAMHNIIHPKEIVVNEKLDEFAMAVKMKDDAGGNIYRRMRWKFSRLHGLPQRIYSRMKSKIRK